LINPLPRAQCRIRQNTKLKEGGTLRASNGERHDRVTLVTEEIRVHSKAEAAKPQDEKKEVIESHGNERIEKKRREGEKACETKGKEKKQKDV